MHDPWCFSWADLATRLPPIPPQAELSRLTPQDFRVTEEALFSPRGSGPHVMVQVEKVGMSTLEAARRLAACVDAPVRDVGFAGRKDVNAVAVQWFTVPRRRSRLPEHPAPGLRVLRTALHHERLRLGQLRGNRFDITLRQPLPGALERLRQRAPQVAAGVPNYFGPQRFGVDGRSAEAGVQVLTGQRRGGDPQVREMLVAALQGMVFNHVASDRVHRDPSVMPETGDLLADAGSGSLVPCTHPADVGPRVRRGELAVTGPLPGSRMRRPRFAPLTWESRIEEEVLHCPTGLWSSPQAPRGDRRAILVRPRDLQVAAEGNVLKVRMTLPPGAFATAVLREWAGITRDGRGSGPGDDPG